MVGFKSFEFKRLNIVLELLNIFVELGFLDFVLFQGMLEKLLLIDFLLIAKSYVLIEIRIICLNMVLQRDDYFLELLNHLDRRFFRLGGK